MIEAISDEDAIMIVIDRKAVWLVELAWLVALLAELGHERAIITRQYLHSMIVRIDNEQEILMMVEHQAHRQVEPAISIALLLGANRELDSSITIKSVVSHHLFQALSQRSADQLNHATTPKTWRERERDTNATTQRSNKEFMNTRTTKR